MASVEMRACPRKETREEDMAFILGESAMLKFFYRAGADNGAFRQSCTFVIIIFITAISRIRWIHAGT